MKNETISVSVLRSNLKKVLAQLKKGKSITITSRGKTIGIISPVPDKKVQARKYMDWIKKTAKIGDIVSPLSVKWEAEA